MLLNTILFKCTGVQGTHLQNLANTHLGHMCECLKPSKYPEGSAIQKNIGQLSPKCFIMTEGRWNCCKNGSGSCQPMSSTIGCCGSALDWSSIPGADTLS
uniref:Uncharacterized protein n=1 Tax=Sphaerodactylus townsendi TaxID=933632 RepID=A0ACB8FEI9_9SAUR